MAYTDVITVATGDTWTAANHNTYIRDNFAAGVPAIFTTKGDLVYASGPKAASRLGIGNNYNVLAAISGLPAYQPLSNLIQFSSSQAISTDTISLTFVDVTNSTISLTLNRTSQLFIWLVCSATAQGAEQLRYKLLAGTTESGEALEMFTANNPRQTIQFLYISYQAAGSVTIKAQFMSENGVRVNLYNGKLHCLAIPII